MLSIRGNMPLVTVVCSVMKRYFTVIYLNIIIESPMLEKTSKILQSYCPAGQPIPAPNHSFREEIFPGASNPPTQAQVPCPVSVPLRRSLLKGGAQQPGHTQQCPAATCYALYALSLISHAGPLILSCYPTPQNYCISRAG